MTPTSPLIVGQLERFVYEGLPSADRRDLVRHLQVLVGCLNYEWGSAVNLAIRIALEHIDSIECLPTAPDQVPF